MKKTLSLALALILTMGLLPMAGGLITQAEGPSWADQPGIAQVSAESSHTVAIKTDGSLWAWGTGSGGQLGLGSFHSRTTPARVGTDTDWASVSAGASHTVAIKSDGSLWAWGNNGSGRLGLGDTTNRDIPARVGTDTDWASVSAGAAYTMAIKTDGSLWAWGYNHRGRLGLGDTADRSSPTRVGTVTEWTKVSAGREHTMAIKTDESLWGWGGNSFRQLGLGETSARHEPTNLWHPPFLVIGVTLNITSLTIPNNHTRQLTATIHPSVAANKNVAWSSSDETVATVDTNGRVTAISEGEATITVTTEDGGFTDTCEVTVIKNIHGIDYETTAANAPNFILPGRVDGDEVPGHTIDLNRETITVAAGYAPAVFSIDGGEKWRAVKADTFSDARFPRLLNKGMTLQISNLPIDRATKKPQAGAVIIEYARINPRPSKAPKLRVNYAIGADPTGHTTGDWVLTERNGTTAVKNNIQIGVADAAQKNRVVDEKHFGQFFPGETNGISVLELTGTKPTRTTYIIRTAPRQDGTAFTPAGKTVRVRVSGEGKRPNYKVKSAGNASSSVKVKALTYVSINNAPAKLYSGKETVEFARDARVEVWQGATPKRPATAKQMIRR